MPSELRKLELEDRSREELLPPDPRASFDHGLRVIWRWRRRFLLTLGFCCVIGCAASTLVPREYAARATVLVGFRPPELTTTDQIARAPVQREPDTDAAIELMGLESALSDVANRLKLADRTDFQMLLQPGAIAVLRHRVTTWVGGRREGGPSDPIDLITDTVRKNLRIERIGHSALVSVSYFATDPKLAAAIANAVASSPVEDSFIKNFPVAERAGIAIVRTSIVSPAAVPHQPAFPNSKLMLLATGVVSFSIALTTVLLGEYYAGQTLRGTEDSARRGLRVLGLVPQLRRRTPLTAVISKITDRPEEAFAESIAALERAVKSICQDRGIVLFTSALALEGKSTIAAAVAASMTSNGARVLLIDANLRAPSLQRAFQAGRSRPDEGVIGRPDPELSSLVQVEAVSGLSLVTAAALHSGPTGVLRPDRLRRALAEWRTRYDVILIDGPPTFPLGDAQALAPLSDHAVFVVRWGKTRATALHRGMRLLAESGVRTAGIVLSRVDMRKLAPEDSPYTMCGRRYRRRPASDGRRG